jgi:hypothetical protein
MNIPEDLLRNVARFRHALGLLLAEAIRAADGQVTVEEGTGAILVNLPRSHGHARLPAYRVAVEPVWPPELI